MGQGIYPRSCPYHGIVWKREKLSSATGLHSEENILNKRRSSGAGVYFYVKYKVWESL